MANRTLLGLLFTLPALVLPAAVNGAQCGALISHRVDDILGGKEDLCQYAVKFPRDALAGVRICWRADARRFAANPSRR